MRAPYCNSTIYNGHARASAAYAGLTTGRDFLTPDGVLVPRALGEAGLRQRTALLIGGMLVGNWPEAV